MGSNKNNAVSIARVIGMLMIIACHLFSWVGMTTLGQIFNVGVELFLIISGVLYARKDIGKPKQFIITRWVKLCVPMYLWVIALLPFEYYANSFTALLSILVYAFNVQGLEFIFLRASLPLLSGAGHLWFLTVIMICYLLLIPIKRLEYKACWNSRKSIYLSMGVLLVLSIALIFAGIQIGYFTCYFLGYVIGKQEGRLKVSKFSLTTIAMIISMGLRIVGKIYMDNTVIYNNGIAVLTHIVLALWLYRLIQLLSEKIETAFTRISSSKTWKCLEEYSFYIYITHYAFLVGPFNIERVNSNRVLQIVLFVIGTVISAWILKSITSLIVSRVFHKQKY